ncbi:HAMP domain-containing protein [Cohnella sp. CFH 77786]|uniref:HAMP domain-containing sensor histidine kinase n=1 Tax=Cohnella sp. CFH 77786 TaxID=2662265 RepID=UPI001C60AC12|nr:HAMP domain-containing sensor histidine kinase [Cohnella sp. CFH 77786]MBW5444962.1 HAMP domain-containing protein [Cohnella sp. CFH 77786]
MRTIRGRLFLSLFLVMVFSIAVTIVLFSRYTTELFRDQARTQLEIQLEKALEVLNGGQISDLDDAALELRFKNHLFNADYAVLNSANKVVASSDTSWIGTVVSAGPSGTTGKLRERESEWLYTVDDIDPGKMRLMLFTPIEDLTGFNRQWIGVSAAALGASTLFIFMVGFLFVWNTTRPLKRLQKAVGEFQPYQQATAIPEGETESEIGQLINTFRSMAERIRHHHEHQQAFLHTVSHELKTPLMSIQGYALAIQDQVVPVHQAVGVIRTESARVVQMVEKLLEWSRLESTNEAWPTQNVDLREMAEHAAEIIAPFAGERQVDVKVAGPESAEAEAPADQVFQVLLNLVHNAVRHSKGNVRITVEETGGGWAYRVEDDGDGVPEAMRERIFSRFFKGPGGGTGLGLAICRRIGERIGATIACGDSPMGGASFEFRFPSAKRKTASVRHGDAG